MKPFQDEVNKSELLNIVDEKKRDAFFQLKQSGSSLILF